MKTHEQKCDEAIATLTRCIELLCGVKADDKAAAKKLDGECRHLSYEGAVLSIRMDEMIGHVLSEDVDCVADAEQAVTILTTRFAGTALAADRASYLGWVKAGWTPEELLTEGQEELCEKWIAQCQQAQLAK